MEKAKPSRGSRRYVAGSALGVIALVVVSACSSSKPTASGSTAPTTPTSSSSGATSSAPSSNSAPAAAATGLPDTTPSPSCPTATKKLNMGFVYSDTTQNPFQEMALGAQAAADQDGNVNLTLAAPNGVNNTQEVQMLESVAQKATDGVGWDSVAPDVFTRALTDATKAGVSIVAVDAAPPAGTGVNTFVGNSNTQVGELLGEAFLAQNPDPNGTVVLGNDIPSLQLLVQRLNGVQNVIKQKAPNMKILGPFNTGSTNTENLTLWKSVYNAHPGAVAYIGVGSQDGVSLPLIEKSSGKKFLIGSADLPPQALQSVKDGTIFALSSPEHWMKGYIAMWLLIHSKRTCTPLPQGWWNSGGLVVDKTNIDAVIARESSNAARWKFYQPEVMKQLANPPIQPLSAAN